MENAAHTLSGLVLARLGPDERGPWATALLVTAANFPDIDCVSLFWDLPTYLRWHHGITHSVVGVGVTGPLLGLVFYALASWRGHAPKLSTYTGLAFLGLLAHCALDAMLNYGMRPWLPFDDTWYYGDVIFVADPWVWWVLGAGALLGGPRRGRGLVAWSMFAVATVVVSTVAYHQGRTPIHAGWVLAPLWGVVLGLRARGVGEGRRKRFAAASLVMFASYVVFLFLMGAVNRARGTEAIATAPEFSRDDVRGVIVATSITPIPCVPWQHRVVVQTADSIFVGIVDGMSGRVVVAERAPNGLADPRLLDLAPDEVYKTWRGFARHPVAAWRDGGWILGDARYPDGWCDLWISVE